MQYHFSTFCIFSVAPSWISTLAGKDLHQSMMKDFTSFGILDFDFHGLVVYPHIYLLSIYKEMDFTWKYTKELPEGSTHGLGHFDSRARVSIYFFRCIKVIRY